MLSKLSISISRFTLYVLRFTFYVFDQQSAISQTRTEDKEVQKIVSGNAARLYRKVAWMEPFDCAQDRLSEIQESVFPPDSASLHLGYVALQHQLAGGVP